MKTFSVYWCLLVVGFGFVHCSTERRNVLIPDRLVFYYEILHRVEQPLAFDIWLEQGASLNLNRSAYTAWTKSMEDFHQASLRQQLLPRSAFFGELVKSHRSQALGLFHFLSKALTWEVFVQNACWARQRTHPHMFVYAMEMAAAARYENVNLLPAIYEILPRHFFDAKFVKDAAEFEPSTWTAPQTDLRPQIYETWQWWRQLGLSSEHWYELTPPKDNNTNRNESVARSWWCPNDYSRALVSEEQPRVGRPHITLSYFTEDADWGAFWYYANLLYSYPLEGNTDKPWLVDIAGEYWFHCLEKYLARYNMELLSHGFGPIPDFDWERAIGEGYEPALSALNGAEFTARPNDWIPARAAGQPAHLVEARETLNYIKRLIDAGTYTMRNGSTVDLRQPAAAVHIHNLLRGHRDPFGEFIPSNWYALAHMYFAGVGKAEAEAAVAPHVLLNFETMPREPFFYIFHNELLKLRHYFDAQLPPYTREELHVPGIQLLDFNISKLVTYDDFGDFDASNLLSSNLSFDGAHLNWRENLFARRLRLNHKPFDVNVTVHANRRRTLLLRFYLAPQFDEYGRRLTLEENRYNFIELSNIERTLSAGVNNFTFTYAQLIQPQREEQHASQSKAYRCALDDDCKLNLANFRHDPKNCGLHGRLLLPHGRIDGLPMQLFVMASDDDTINRQIWWQPCKQHYGQRTLGYPFDRPIPRKAEFLGTNMLFKEVKIYHKTWQAEELDDHSNSGEQTREAKE